MDGQLLIKKSSDETLDEFVAAMDKIIGPMKWVEHESSNYVDERYFLASAIALEVRIAIADDAEFRDYDFSIFIDANFARVDELSFLAGVADAVAKVVCLHGYEVLRPNDSRKTGNGGFVYRSNPDTGLRTRERIIAESI